MAGAPPAAFKAAYGDARALSETASAMVAAALARSGLRRTGAGLILIDADGYRAGGEVRAAFVADSTNGWQFLAAD